jgi:hypothetical protein
MAWIDCMRLRRVAAIVRTVGWIVATIGLCIALLASFATESSESLWAFGVFLGIAVAVLGAAHLIAWAIDRRGERLVTR